MASDSKTPAAVASDVMGLDAAPSGNITLKSADGKSFEVPKQNAFLSNLVKTCLQTDPDATEVPIPGVKGEILARIVEYMNYHQGKDPGIPDKPLRSKIMKEVCPQHPWDAEFIDAIGVQRQTLYDLILAANYMDMKSLLHLGCAKVASLIKGVPLNKIKSILDPNFVESDNVNSHTAGADDKKDE